MSNEWITGECVCADAVCNLAQTNLIHTCSGVLLDPREYPSKQS